MNSYKVLLIWPKWYHSTLWGLVKFKFPMLSLLTLAALCPDEFDVQLCDENFAEINYSGNYDLVGISAMTPLAMRAYKIADKFRAKGTTVVMGGIHPSWMTEEALQHCDAVVVGEAEKSWPRLLEDFKKNDLQKVYKQEVATEFRNMVNPRRELLKGNYVTKSTIQTTRGCPYDCEFCSVTAFFGRRYRCRPVDEVIEEVKSIKEKFIFFVDDNIIGNKKYGKKLFEKLKPLNKWWASQATINIADDSEILSLMAQSGCIALFMGLESLSPENLKAMGKTMNSYEKYFDSIKKIQEHGIGIQGSFVVGLDGDDKGVFDRIYEFVNKTKLEAVLNSVLTPFPGTKTRSALEQQNRILSDDWSKYTMNNVVFQPKNMTPEELETGFNSLNRSLHSYSSIFNRLFPKMRKNLIIFLPQNIGFRGAWEKYCKKEKL